MQKQPRTIYWPVTLFMILNPLFAVIGLVYAAYNGLLGNPGIWAFAFLYWGVAGLSITAGYHRMLSHRSYQAHPLVELFFLLGGASAFEGSALKWSSDHRRHHSEVDTENDPYNINRGFWHAHLTWLFYTDTVDLPIERVDDLKKNPRVMFQHRYFIPVAIFMAFGVPAIVGACFGSAFAGFLIAGSLRIVMNQHCTFFINSLCHMVGRQTYSKAVSARDSFLIALLTNGEGYHNFHHTFQIDYRNGIKWYHWDPTKWTILALKWVGMAEKLRTISPGEILKARLQVESLQLTSRGFSQEKVEQMKLKILEAQNRWRQMKVEYANLKQQARVAGEAKMKELRYELWIAKKEFTWALEHWQFSMRAGYVRI